ncbi:MAG: lactaldehyde reductase [Clostridiales bacterium]|nr:lactaldehyde reductase [Clostridiales bacterium]
MSSRFILNEFSYFGRGSRAELVPEIQKRGFKKVFVVTDESLVKCGVAGKVTELLDAADIKYVVYSDVKPNPTIANVLAGVAACKKFKADVIVTVGGGSAMDTAKGVSILMTNPKRTMQSLNGVSNTANKGLPIIALPTTAGTASEVTINYVITDEERQIKMVCVDPNDLPIVAIVDSELMETMPASLAAATGLDALTHAVEGYITKGHNLMSDMFHMEAIKLIFANLTKAVMKKDKDAIEKMSYAQYIAGMGFSNVGLGIVHSMAHQLGAVYDTPHGIANAMLLPVVMKFNGDVCADRFAEILEALGVETKGMTKKQKIDKFVSMIEELSASVKVTQTIKDYGCKMEDIDMLADKAMEDPCKPGNPKDVTKEDFIKLYKEAMKR